MKLKKSEPKLNYAQKRAIDEARKGNPYPLSRLINSLEEFMARLKGPVNDDELGRWIIGMHGHYSFILNLLKAVELECGSVRKVKHVKRVQSV